MAATNTYLSDSQALGKLNTYITLFILSIFILIALFFLYINIFNYEPKPPCSTTSPGEDCENVPRAVSITVISIILIILVVIFYFNFSLKDNKAYQTARGVRAQADLMNNLYRRPVYIRPMYRRPQVTLGTLGGIPIRYG